MNKKQYITSTLLLQGISLDSTIEYKVNDKIYTLTYKEIIDNYFLASQSSQEIFYQSFQKVAQSKKSHVEDFFEKMGQLLLMSSLSKKL